MICTQGKVIPDLIAWWCERDGVRPDKSRNRKGSTWVMSLSAGPFGGGRPHRQSARHQEIAVGRRASVDELREADVDWLADVRQGIRSVHGRRLVFESVPSAVTLCAQAHRSRLGRRRVLRPVHVRTSMPPTRSYRSSRRRSRRRSRTCRNCSIWKCWRQAQARSAWKCSTPSWAGRLRFTRTVRRGLASVVEPSA